MQKISLRGNQDKWHALYINIFMKEPKICDMCWQVFSKISTLNVNVATVGVQLGKYLPFLFRFRIFSVFMNLFLRKTRRNKVTCKLKTVLDSWICRVFLSVLKQEKARLFTQTPTCNHSCSDYDHLGFVKLYSSRAETACTGVSSLNVIYHSLSTVLSQNKKNWGQKRKNGLAHLDTLVPASFIRKI